MPVDGHARAGRRSRGARASRASRSGRRSTRACSSWCGRIARRIVFVNSRRSAERVANRLNELGEEDIARAHHGSLAREQRLEIEDLLKTGRLPALVATSSLELGIDMGAVDLVVQIESPKSVAAGLQRVGRAGHQVGDASSGRFFPKFRGDLLETAVVTRRMHEGEIEHTRVPRHPLDVLAQQIVAMTAMDEWEVDELHRVVCRAHPYRDLSLAQLEGVLDMLAGRYPSDEFAELRPRIVWDRTDGAVRGRDGAKRLAVISGGTIPDRGLYGVFMAEGGARVGELDEEMVYEARDGEVFQLGASSWRIEQITRDRVLVSPAPGRARQAAVLEGRRHRPARTSWARRSGRPRAPASSGRSTRWRPPTSPTISTTRSGPPAWSPPTARS